MVAPNAQQPPPKPPAERELDPVREVGAVAGQKNPSLKLLRDYEEMIGVPLRRLEGKDVVTLKTGMQWPWSWAPEDAGIFLSEWERHIYLVNTLLRELAFTTSPDGDTLMYERFCRPEVAQAIEKVEIMYDLPIGTIPVVPIGTFSVDLRPAPPYHKSTIFRINHWNFCGLVRNLPEDLAHQLRYMHGLWYSEGMRVFMPFDHGTQEIGEVRGAA